MDNIYDVNLYALFLGLSALFVVFYQMSAISIQIKNLLFYVFVSIGVSILLTGLYFQLNGSFAAFVSFSIILSTLRERKDKVKDQSEGGHP